MSSPALLPLALLPAHRLGTGALHEYSVPTPLAHVAYWRKIETYLSASSLVCIFLWALGQFSLRAWH